MSEHKGFTLWITGPDTGLCAELAGEVGGTLLERGCKVEILDEPAIDQHLAAGLSDSVDDQNALVSRIGFVSGILARNEVIAVAAPNSPKAEARDRVRDASYASFILVHAKADAAEGYEEPAEAEVVCDTTAEDTEASVGRILLTLASLDLIPKDESAEYSEEEEAEVMRRLKDLGYV